MINKGLKSLVESSPNFSNQSLENAITGLRIGWVAKSLDLDTTITDNSVLSSSQKNDVKDTIKYLVLTDLNISFNDSPKSFIGSIIARGICTCSRGIKKSSFNASF